MIIFRLLSLIAFVSLSACAAAPEKESSPKESSVPVKPAENEKKAEKAEPETAIDEDVLFMLLSAEIAGQRGFYDIAYEGYIEAAKRVKDPKLAERAAMIALYVKDDKKVKQALGLWLANDPNNLKARKLALLYALRAADKQASIAHLDAMLSIDPAGFEASLIELASIFQAEGSTDFVYDALEALSQKNPNQPAVFYVQSLLAMQMKKKDQAEFKVEQALKIQPDWDKALILQTQIAFASGDLKGAAELLRKASQKYPDNVQINKMLAQVLIKTGAYEEAAEVYRKLTELDSEDVESRFALGLVYLQIGQDDKAEDIFKKLLETDKTRNQASFYLGKLEEKRDNVKKALAWYDKVSGEPFEFEAPLSAVSLLAKQKQFKEAEERLKSMETRFPKQKVRILIMQAEIFSQQKEYQKAFNLLTTALIQYPDDNSLLYTRALMAERVGKLDVLEDDLKKILDKDPDNAEALNALGYSLLDYPDRYAEAEQYLQKALSLQPDEPVIIDSYGWLQFKLGNASKALIFLEKAYAILPENEIAAHLAEVLWTLDRKTEARKIFDKAIAESPDDEYLLDFQKRFLGGE
ncbi:MAG: tetratricopeptide repeat protein [Gammaproteobacteria bacterium]